MPSKRQRDQWKNARAASLQTFKKRKEESSSIQNLVQPQLDDDKVNTSDTSDTESESGTLFWHESANERDSDSEEEEYSDVEEPILEEDQPSHEGSTRLESQPKEVKWNKEKKDKLRGVYGKGVCDSNKTTKSTRELELEASKIYKFRAL